MHSPAGLPVNSHADELVAGRSNNGLRVLPIGALDLVSPWRTEAALAGSRDVRLKAILAATKAPYILGVPRNIWLILVLHGLGLAALYSGHTYFWFRVQGALRGEGGYDLTYTSAVIIVVFGCLMLFLSLFGSDPGWVKPGEDFGGYLAGPCEFCGLQPPIRSRHCHHTGQCVIKFDHYCHLLCTSIGDCNHQRFFWYLIIQAFTAFWALLLVGHALYPCVAPSSPRHQLCWSSSPVRSMVLLVAGAALSVAFCAISSLALLHTYFAITGQTTYEVMSGPRVPYLAPFYARYKGPHRASVPFSKIWPEIGRRMLKGTPPPAPFSLGISENLNIFFFSDKPYNHVMQVSAADLVDEETGLLHGTRSPALCLDQHHCCQRNGTRAAPS